MSGIILWGWDDTNKVYRQVLLDSDGKLKISDADPFEITQDTPEDLKHLPHGSDHEASPTYRPIKVDSSGHQHHDLVTMPELAQDTASALKHLPHAQVTGDGAYKPLQLDANDYLMIAIKALEHLNDITDVNVPTPADQQGIEYDTATSKWILTNFIRHALLTTQGDIIIRGASLPERLALGTEGHYLKAGASEPGWAAAPVLTRLASFAKAESRVLGAADGDVSYTGYGFEPTCLVAFGRTTGTTEVGTWGFCDSALTELCIYQRDDGKILYATHLLNFRESAGNTATCVVKSFDADGFTLTWTKAGSPAQTGEFIVLALR